MARRRWCGCGEGQPRRPEHVHSSSPSSSSNTLLLLLDPTVESKSCKDLPAGLWYSVPLIITLVIILNPKVNLTPALIPAFTTWGLFSCFVRQHLIKAETSLLLLSASWTEKVL